MTENIEPYKTFHSGQGIRAAIPTTTAFGKLRGFTLTVLEVLESEGLTSRQVAEITEKSNLYVNVYLFRLQKYGLASKNEGFWFLTEKGVRIWSLLKKRYNNNNNNNRSITQQQHNNNRSITLHSEPRLIQPSLASWCRGHNLNDVEAAVVDVLAKHYDETSKYSSGGKFIYASSTYDLAERFGVNPSLLPDAMRRLHEDQVIYQYPLHPRPGEYFKVALKKDFVKKLEASQRT